MVRSAMEGVIGVYADGALALAAYPAVASRVSAPSAARWQVHRENCMLRPLAVALALLIMRLRRSLRAESGRRRIPDELCRESRVGLGARLIRVAPQRHRLAQGLPGRSG